MSRINTNVQSLIAQNNLAKQNQAMAISLQRLSTGLQINSAKDDPAGLIASENLRSQEAGTTQAISNAQRADSIMGTADGALNEVSALLVKLQTLVTQTASSGGLSPTEISANQAQVDSILSSIDRISTSTQFGGKKLLDGSLAYVTSGIAGGDIKAATINSAQLVGSTPQTVSVDVVTAATNGLVTHTAAAASATLGSAVSFQITGNKGVQTIALTSAMTVADVATAINAVKAATGVSATTSAAVLKLDSQGLGHDQFVSVQAVSGSFATSALSANGTDPVVNVNGTAASTNDMSVTFASPTLSVGLSLTSSFATTPGNSTFYITGGGANFMVGSNATLSNQVNMGIGSVATGSLGNSTDGYLGSLASGGANSLSGGHAISAQTIVTNAVGQVSNLRGQLGSFQKFTLEPTINSLQVSLENVTAADSAIRDTNFASETANLTRSQILSNAATSVLSLANSMPQSVLSLLKGA